MARFFTDSVSEQIESLPFQSCVFPDRLLAKKTRFFLCYTLGGGRQMRFSRTATQVFVVGREPLPRWLLISCVVVYILTSTRFGELKRRIGRS